jgi:transposase-like protein
MQHANAPLTPNGRLRMVMRVEEQGMTFEAAAAASNVAKSTCWDWVKRWREVSNDERRTLACLVDRPSRPHTSPAQVTGGGQIILPVWHRVTKAEVVGSSPSLADKLARSTSEFTVDEIADEIAQVIKATRTARVIPAARCSFG